MSRSAFSLIFIFALSAPTFRAQAQNVSAALTPVKKEQAEEQSLLQRHHPFYFAYGRPLSKLQLSFKTPVIKTWPLYFGYTQTMFWALHESSKPFRDFTYNPELFYRWRPKDSGVLKSMDFGLWSHHSNGKAGDNSRSYDANDLRFNFAAEGTKWTTRLSLQLSFLHGLDKPNRDIQSYVGPVTAELRFVQLFDSWVDKSEISMRAAPGGKFAQDWDRGGYQLDWSFRLGGVRLVPAFYLQYYRGYAETLLNYSERVNVFRAGVIF
jgi:phospholipase A1